MTRIGIPIRFVDGEERPLLYGYEPPVLPEGYVPPADRAPIRLHEIDLYVTMRCNIRCEFCNVRAGEYNHRDIPLEDRKSTRLNSSHT